MYTLNDLALRLGIAPQRVRVKLRKLGVERTGDRYGWPDRAAFEEVVLRVNGRQPSKPRPLPVARDFDADDALLDPEFDGE